jgi:DNA-binding NtrC family response regulator
MNRTYLIVDDSSVIRQTLEKMLRRFTDRDERILTAESSEEALEVFRAEKPDIVLLDIMLPDVDGDQTAQVMFNEDPDTRVVVITGLMEEDPRVREMIMKGAFDFLQKPIHSSDVEELIRLLEQEEGGSGRIK